MARTRSKLARAFDRPFRRLAVNAGWLVAGGAVASLLVTTQAIIAARILGNEGYGRFALIAGSVAFVVQFADFRTWEAAIKTLPEKLIAGRREEVLALIGCLLLVDVGSGTLAFGVVLVSSELILEFVAHDRSLSFLTVIYATSLPMTLISSGTCIGVLRAFDRFDLITLKSVVFAAVQLALVAAVLLSGHGLKGLLLAYVASEFLNAATSLALVAVIAELRRDSIGKLNLKDVFVSLRSLGGLLRQLWLSGTIKGAQTKLDTILLGVLTSPASVGHYRLAVEVSTMLSKVGNPIQAAILPIFCEMKALRRDKEITVLARSTTLLLTCLFAPVVLFVIFFSSETLVFIAGKSYAPAGPLLVFLSVGICINTVLSSWARPALVAKSMVETGNVITGATAILGILGFLVLVPKWGILGASIVAGSVYALSGILTAVAVERKHDSNSAVQRGSGD